MPKKIDKLFPKSLNAFFKYDTEGLWSITHVKEAEYLSKKIIHIANDTNVKIIDMTAGCGGNLISFMLYFKNVTGIEIDKDRYDMLEHNIKQYKHNCNINLINDDCLNQISDNYDVYFFDPPWGGPTYKNEDNVKLYISEIELRDIIKIINKNKLIALKIPFNYDYKYIQKEYILLENTLIKNIRFLIFYTL
jgi:predicted RNA methylase